MTVGGGTVGVVTVGGGTVAVVALEVVLAIEGSLTDAAELAEVAGALVEVVAVAVGGAVGGTAVAVAVLVAVAGDVLLEGGELVVALVLDGSVLVLSVDENGGGVLNFLAASVFLDDLVVDLLSDVEVTEPHSADRNGLNSGELLPLNGKALAAAAGRVHEGDDPHVLGVGDDGLLEGLGFEAVVLLPGAIVLPDDSGLVRRSGVSVAGGGGTVRGGGGVAVGGGGGRVAVGGGGGRVAAVDLGSRGLVGRADGLVRRAGSLSAGNDESESELHSNLF